MNPGPESLTPRTAEPPRERTDSPASFEDYVAATQARWTRAAYRLCADRDQAQDLVAHAWEKLYLRWSKVVAQGDPDRYVATVLHHRFLDDRRSRRWRSEVRVGEVPERAVRGVTEDEVVAAHSLAAAWRRLTAEERAVVGLRAIDGHPLVEVTRLLPMSHSTVRRRWESGCDKLRAHTDPRRPTMTPDESFRERLDQALGADTLTAPPVADVVTRGRAAARRRARRRAAGGVVAVALVVAGSVGLAVARGGTGAVDPAHRGPQQVRALRSDGDELVARGVGVRCSRDLDGAQVLSVTNLPPDEADLAPGGNYLRFSVYVDRVTPGQVVRLPTPDTTTPEGVADIVADLGFFQEQDSRPQSDSGSPEYFSSIAGARGTVRVDHVECGSDPSADLDLDVVLQAEEDVPLTVRIRQRVTVDEAPLAG